MTEKDFDEFIRKAASSNLSPDECFNWEHMNIPIPKRKKRRSLFMFFLLEIGALLFLGGMYCFIESSKIQSARIIAASIGENLPHILGSYKVENTGNSLTTPRKSNNDYVTEEDTDLISVRTKSNESNLRSASVSLSYLVPDNVKWPVESLNNDTYSDRVDIITTENTTIRNETTSFEKIEPRSFDRFYFDSPVLSTNKLKPDKRLSCWFVRAGVLTYKNLIVHNEFTDTYFGRSSSGLFVAVSKHHSFRRNWFLETGFTYSRLNHFYRGAQDLGYINDISASQRISSRRIIKHNNLVEIAEIQLGLGKVIPLHQNFQFLSSISVLPGVVTRRAGRVFLPNESTPISIEENTSGFPLSLSSELMLGFQYKMMQNIGIGIIAANKYYFTRIPILNEKQQPYILDVGLFLRIDIVD
jgi:hypothetical protein